MRDRELIRMLTAAGEDLDRALTVIQDALIACRDARNGWPRAARLDTTGRGGGSHWCWEHERDVGQCHRAGSACDGEVVSGPSDPAGEAAIETDVAARDRDQLARSARSIAGTVRSVEQFCFRYLPRPASDIEKQATAAANERSDDCRSCARTKNSAGAPRFSPVHRETTIGDGRWPLCRWCYDFVRDTARLPSPAELEDHHRGKYVRRSA